MPHLYAGSILIIDLTSREIRREPTTNYARDWLGGRGINIRLFYDHINPGADPLGPGNVLVFGVGPLGGTTISAGRTEVTAKSPETGYLGSSNFGGFFASELKFAGYDHIVFKGRSEDPVYLWIDNRRVEIRDAGALWGKDTYEVPELIREEIGDPELRVACIGQGGENLVRFASIQHELGHGAGRTGMGAVMGSKNLKAIAVRGTQGLTLANPLQFSSIAAELEAEIQRHPRIARTSKEGVSRYYDEGYNEDEALAVSLGASGEGVRPELPSTHASYLKYSPKRAGCYGCPVQCMDHYQAGEEKSGVISCELYPEFTMEVRCFDSDTSLECAIKCQKYGLDAVSTARIIKWLMELHEKGIINENDTDGLAMEWGNPQAIRGMVEKIAHRQGVGDILAEGILAAASAIGRGSVAYADQTKGLPMSEDQNAGWMPYVPGNSLATAVGPRGDSLRSLGSWISSNPDHLSPEAMREIAGTEKAAEIQTYEGKPEYAVWVEDVVTINDILSTCKWLTSWMYKILTPERQAALYSGGSGADMTVETLSKYAQKVRTMERAYEALEGLTSEQDTLPKRFIDNPIKSGPWEGAVLDSERFEAMKRRYYTLRGWDPETGIPAEETLCKLGLADIAEDLKSIGKLR